MCWQTLRRRNAALVQGTELDLALPGHFDFTDCRLEIHEPMLIGPTHWRHAGYPLILSS